MFSNNDFINIDKILSDRYDFYAHINEGKKETLDAHTNLCKKYFMKIDESKNLYEIFERILNLLFKDVSINSKKLYFKMISSTISLHDTGKVNPNFQEDKMKNKIKFSERSNFNLLSSRHSIISAVFYIDYFLDEVLSMSKEERNGIMPFMFFNSYIISKHHGNMDEFYEYLDGFNEGDASKAIDALSNSHKDLFSKEFNLSCNKAVKMINFIKKHFFDNLDREKALIVYTYERLLYSVLVACDYYATTEFMSGVEIKNFGDINEINEFYDVYKNTYVYKSIRDYENNDYKSKTSFDHVKDINILRDEMFLDSERELINNINNNIFFLEAPTGSGKSNVSMNLSFKLMEYNKKLSKIFYVYPFNTLVEQNINSIKKIFGADSDVFNKVTVINSIFPIKMDKDNQLSNPYKYYQKALLDRQFLNYPFILTTHVSIFNIMFNSSRESIFGFQQFINSVVVLDEIQSYKNIIWTEIISFLKVYAKVLNMKIIIMSATLPDLNSLTDSSLNTVNLINDREKYFSNHLFKNRVKVNYDLLIDEFNLQMLYEHVKNNCKNHKKILIEFIKRQTAYEFYNMIAEDGESTSVVELMTGDDNSVERKRIIDRICSRDVEEKGIILVATQVIEAGIDIDMDIGYKDISKVDSDEQFMGRINRSCKKDGIVYFFNLDNMKAIYKDDIRADKEFSLLNDSMKDILVSKKFYDYYKLILQSLKNNYNNTLNEDINIDEFFKKAGRLDFKEVEERMKLIDDDNWSMSVFLCYELQLDDGTVISGKDVWDDYKKLLMNNSIDYAEKTIKLSEITSKMNYFIYEIKKNDNFTYNDKAGSLYCIENGDEYFKNGKLDKEKFITGVGEFI